MMRRFLSPAFLIALTVPLGGCLGDVMAVFCEGSPDSDHCYQASAVQEGNDDNCDKIKGFGGGSNPPKDKCFLQIAGNTGDPSVCGKIQGGMMSYTEEECVQDAFRGHTVEDCKDAEDEMRCRAAWASYGKNCGEGYMVVQGACVKEPPTPDNKGADDDIESKVEGDLTTIKDAATGKYMELLTKAIEDEQDDAKKLGLEKYKEFLEKGGEKFEEFNATVDKLKELKKIFLDAYDPSMDVNKMPVNKILDPGLFDRIKSRVFGEDAPDARSQADDSLSVYEAMLKRQGDIDFLQQSRLNRLKDTIVSKVKDEATDKLKEGVKDIAEGVAGTAFATVGIVDHALTTFKDGAQKEAFLGLAAAYNRQRDAMTAAHPDMSPEEIHKRVTAQVKADPYQDNTNLGFVKFGNLLENDCQAGGNPLCIDNRVFWTAMDKTYEYQHKKK